MNCAVCNNTGIIYCIVQTINLDGKIVMDGLYDICKACK